MRVLFFICCIVLNISSFSVLAMAGSSVSEAQRERTCGVRKGTDFLQQILIPSYDSTMSCIESFDAHIVPCSSRDSVHIFMPGKKQIVRALGNVIGYVELLKKIDELRTQGFFEDQAGLQLKKDHYLVVNGVENSIRAAMLIMSLKIMNPDQVLVYRDVGRHLDFNALGVADNNQLYIDKESLARLRLAYDRVLQNLPLDIIVASYSEQSGYISLSRTHIPLNPGALFKIRQRVLQILHSRVSDAVVAINE